MDRLSVTSSSQPKVTGDVLCSRWTLRLPFEPESELYLQIKLLANWTNPNPLSWLNSSTSPTIQSLNMRLCWGLTSRPDDESGLSPRNRGRQECSPNSRTFYSFLFSHHARASILVVAFYPPLASLIWSVNRLFRFVFPHKQVALNPNWNDPAIISPSTSCGARYIATLCLRLFSIKVTDFGFYFLVVFHIRTLLSWQLCVRLHEPECERSRMC